MSILYIVATPIGNLEDISMRALRVLGEVDFILCEDTRVTKKLLNHYKINTSTISYHQHSDMKKIEQILELLGQGKNLAMVADAGTPGISDPGGKLVQAVIERFNVGALRATPVQIESVPGPSAVTAALSISGIPTDKFVFLGFPPHKKGRQTFLQKVITSEYPVVVYESKHRIIKFLEELKKVSAGCGAPAPQQSSRLQREVDSGRPPALHEKALRAGGRPLSTKKMKDKKIQSIVVCRELSKMHETVYRGEIKNIIEKIKNSRDDQKGEFVVVVGK